MVEWFEFQNVLKDLSWDDQKQLLDETVNYSNLQKYPLDTTYVIRFLRYMIDELESQNLDVHDDLYTTLCSYQSKSNNNAEYSYKHFRIPVNDRTEAVVLKENRNKISQGTTGLNVWESALAISEWAIQNKDIFHNKNILELGAGTGLSSLIISKCCSPKSIHITDGNEKVIENLLENVANNFEKLTNNRYIHRCTETIIGNWSSMSFNVRKKNTRFYLTNSPLFSDVLRLDWSETSKEVIEQNLREIDFIIAADVIYDNSLFDSLLTTVKLLFDHCVNCDKLLLANAVRSPDTEQEFLTKLGNLHFIQDHLKLWNFFYCLHFNLQANLDYTIKTNQSSVPNCFIGSQTNFHQSNSIRFVRSKNSKRHTWCCSWKRCYRQDWMYLKHIKEIRTHFHNIHIITFWDFVPDSVE